MLYWPETLSTHDFDPRQIEAITGVPHAQQRQWRVRYLDFRQAFFVQHDARKRGRWSWEGVQLIGLFARALSDLRDGEMARRVLMLDPEPGTVQDPLGIYHSDQRNPSTGDLLIVGDLSLGAGARFSTTGVDGLKHMLQPNLALTGGEPRPYAVNFSAFQRVLATRAEQVILA